jgi:hypothetical protein
MARTSCFDERSFPSRYSDGTQLTAASFAIHIAYPWRILMRSKLAISAFVVASLFGASLTASAQTQPAPGASSEGNVGPGASKSGMKSKDGMTTGAGMNSGAAGANKSDARNPSSQGNVGPGTDNNAGRK